MPSIRPFGNLPAPTAIDVSLFGIVSLTDAAVIATNVSLSHSFRVTLGGNRVLGKPTNPYDGQVVEWEISQDATGSRTLTLDSSFRIGTTVTSTTLSTAAMAVDILTARYNAGSQTWLVVAFVKGYIQAPALRAAGTFAAGTGGISPGIPTGTIENDILVLFTESGANEGVATPSGYTSLCAFSSNGASNLGVFWKRATSSESAPSVADSGNHTMGQILGFSGCVSSGSPWGATDSLANTTGQGTASLTIEGVTTHRPHSLMVYAQTSNSGTHAVGYSSWTNSALVSIDERIDAFDASVGGHIGVATGVKLVPGFAGNATVTFINTNTFGGRFCGALLPY